MEVTNVDVTHIFINITRQTLRIYFSKIQGIVSQKIRDVTFSLSLNNEYNTGSIAESNIQQ